ncbi:MAG: hypothetical protein ACK40T_00830 [Akkermansiaceae bacterium]|jgi:hypothetical protein
MKIKMLIVRYVCIITTFFITGSLHCYASEVSKIKISFGIIELENNKIEIYINGTYDKSVNPNGYILSPRLKIELPTKIIYIENLEDVILCLGAIQKGEVAENANKYGVLSMRRMNDIYEIRRGTETVEWLLLINKDQALMLEEKIKNMMGFSGAAKIESVQ